MKRLVAWLLSVVALSGCGRVGYTMPQEGADGGGADACAPRSEECNGVDDDCDGEIDEIFDLQSDPGHCGECNHGCAAVVGGAGTSCRSGECVLDCDPGFGDCDGAIENGCETNLGVPADCGECGVSCSAPTPLCTVTGTRAECSASCAGALCADSCVDVLTNPQHCGGCGLVCPAPANAVPTCVGGSCGFECRNGFGDCDEDAANGCEQRLDTIEHCRACGQRCNLPNASSQCSPAVGCIIDVCRAGFLDCDDQENTGCETPSVTGWIDSDNDGVGANSTPTEFCILPGNYSLVSGDCNDDDPDVFTGQTRYFSVPRGEGFGYDYDCDGFDSLRWTDVFMCNVGPMCSTAQPGWNGGAVPLCGVMATWGTSCAGTDPCTFSQIARTQECR